MGVFIRVEINSDSCAGVNDCGQCIHVCPVGIFKDSAQFPRVDEANEDECTLCGLCLQACEPHAITIRKLYDE